MCSQTEGPEPSKLSAPASLTQPDLADRVDPAHVQVAARLPRQCAPAAQRRLLERVRSAYEDPDVRAEDGPNIVGRHAVLYGDKRSRGDALEARKPRLGQAEGLEASRNDVGRHDELRAAAHTVDSEFEAVEVEGDACAMVAPGT